MDLGKYNIGFQRVSWGYGFRDKNEEDVILEFLMIISFVWI